MPPGPPIERLGRLVLWCGFEEPCNHLPASSLSPPSDRGDHRPSTLPRQTSRRRSRLVQAPLNVLPPPLRPTHLRRLVKSRPPSLSSTRRLSVLGALQAPVHRSPPTVTVPPIPRRHAHPRRQTQQPAMPVRNSTPSLPSWQKPTETAVRRKTVHPHDSNTIDSRVTRRLVIEACTLTSHPDKTTGATQVGCGWATTPAT